MYEDPGNLALQCDLLALRAKLEAARGGDAELRLARQAARLQRLARSGIDADRPPRDGDAQAWLDRRLEQISTLQREIDALAGEIDAVSRRECTALQFEDVESGVVVYSTRHAGELREQLGKIGALRHSLRQGMASDLEALAAMAAMIESRGDEPGEDSAAAPGQIPLDRGDGEMF